MFAAASFVAIGPFLVSTAIAALTADEASDICSLTVDPCVITQTIDVVSGSSFDFGTRAVEIRGGGLLNVGAGSLFLSAGSLLIDVSGTGIKLNDGPNGGNLFVDTFKRCSGNTSVRCQDDGDCDAVAAGVCDQGNGSITLRGRVNGNCELPGLFFLRAAGDVVVQERILLNGTTLESDGGEIEIVSSSSISIEDRVESTSGGDGTGGDILFDAGVDVIINEIVDASGGDFDGGTIEIIAGRDVLITEDLNADANSGEGFGGSIGISSKGNLEVVGGGSGNPLLLTTQGHTGFDGTEAFAGDGGPQDYVVGGNARFGEFVRLRANGAGPDGFGETIAIHADGPILFAGEIETKAKGGQGSGGDIEVSSLVDVELTSTAELDVTGGDSGAGTVYVSSKGNIRFDGSIASNASTSGSGGIVVLDADVEFSGNGIVVGSANAGSGGSIVDIDGCRIQLNSSFDIRNPGLGGRSKFRVAEQFVLSAGASVESGAQNQIEHRDAGVLPVISGDIVPAPSVLVNSALPSCPLCGNAVSDLGETCDDGNQVGGDGCSSDCQDEGCIAATPGYPSVPLCDDGNDCSVDSCDPAAGGCQNVASCDDGFLCTVDTCAGDLCIHTPSDAFCNDNNVCTEQFCSATQGCVFATVNLACDDELYCNGADSCLAGGCALHTGDPCSGFAECLNVCDELVETCTASFGHSCTPDANPCTDDVCNGLGSCIHLANSAPCDDGVFCNGPDLCVGGVCSLSGGNPCSASDPCADTCDEARGLCTAPPDVPCADDANICTDDICDGSGSCLHVANVAPCDDGDLCTVTDLCTAGVCVATDGGAFSSIRVIAQKKGGAANDKLTLRAKLVGADIVDGPVESGVLFEVRGTDGNLLYGSFLPAENFIDSGLKGTTFKFRDTKGVVPSANGVAVATIKRSSKRDEIRAKLKMRGTEIPAVVEEISLSPALLIGGSPLTGRCGSASALVCTKKGSSKLSCSD